MENSLKQRLIGALVLIALAVIFLPAILKDQDDTGHFVSKIPDKPENLKTFSLVEPKVESPEVDKNSWIDLKNPSSNNPQSGDSAILNGKSTKEPVEKTLSQDSINVRKKTKIQSSTKPYKEPIASGEKLANTKQEPSKESKPLKGFKRATWIVQIASFSNKENAEKMVNKLKQSDHLAYSRRIKQSGRALYRVFVGPFLKKSEASKSRELLQEQLKSNPIILTYDPVKH